MAIEFGGEFEVQHSPPAARFDNGNQNLVELMHMSQKSSLQIPKSRKERVDSEGVRGIPKALTATDVQGTVGLARAYSGEKKPVLVLRFEQHGDGYSYSIGFGLEIRVIHGVHGGRDDYHAELIQLRKRGERKLLGGGREISPFMAFKALANKERWFYHMGAWRSLMWVYRQVLCTGFLSPVKIPREHESYIYANDLLHVEGAWLWQTSKIRQVPEARKVVLIKATRGRTLEMPAQRSSERFIQDVDTHGRTTKTSVAGHFVQRHYHEPNRPYKPGRMASTPQGGSSLDPYTGGSAALLKDGGLV